MSKTYSCRPDDVITKLIINLWPQVFLYQVHLWTTWCSNMMFVMYNPWPTQRSNKKTSLRFRLGCSSWSPPTRFLHHCSGESGSPPAELWDSQVVPSSGPHPESLGRRASLWATLSIIETFHILRKLWHSLVCSLQLEERVQPPSRSLVPDLVLCGEVNPPICSWHCSTSGISCVVCSFSTELCESLNTEALDQRPTTSWIPKPQASRPIQY